MARNKVNRDEIKRIVLSQHDKPFSYHDIVRESKFSYPVCMEVINEALNQKQIAIDHKEGKTVFYVVSQFAKETNIAPAVNPMMLLTPTERFQYIGALTDNVIGGFSPSLLITGLSGIGKTYLVKQRLESAGMKDGIDFNFVQGHSTPMGLYRFLHDHRDQITIFDDCDSVFDDGISTNILKSALDSYEVRKVCWNSTKLPEDLEASFEFTGQIIFVSNRMADRVDEAVKSRTMVINLQMSRKEIIEYMRDIVEALDPKNMSTSEKMEVIDYLDEVKDSLDQLNLRTLIKISRIRQGSKHLDWRKMAMVLD